MCKRHRAQRAQAEGTDEFSHLVTVVHGGDYLSEEASRLPLAQAPTLANVVIQLALAGILHHNHDLVLVLKH